MLPVKELVLSTAKTVGTEIAKRSPLICAGIAVAGVIGTAVLAYKASPKAHEIIANKKQDLEDVPKTDKALRRKIYLEMAKELGLVLAPVVISGVITIAMIFGCYRISLKRQAALSAAYEFTSQAFKEYQDKTRIIAGKKKEESIREEIAKDHVKYEMPAAIVIAGEGPNTFYDYPHGRVVKYDIEKLRSKLNKLNYLLRSTDFVSENDLYDELGWPHVLNGDENGWNSIDGSEIEIDIQWVSDDDGRPIGYLTYYTRPRIKPGDM